MLEIIPISLAEANSLIEKFHRHHKPVVGHKFSIGLLNDEGQFVGAIVIGRPVARMTDRFRIAEVTRLVTNGEHNACSKLYASAARAAEAMGYSEIQTF